MEDYDLILGARRKGATSDTAQGVRYIRNHGKPELTGGDWFEPATGSYFIAQLASSYANIPI